MNEFSIDIRQLDGEWNINVFDIEGEWVARASGGSMGDCMRHAIYEASPLAAAACWPQDYLNWSQQHLANFSEREASCPECNRPCFSHDGSYFCETCGIDF